MKEILRFNHLTKKFGNKIVLKNAELSMDQGDIVGLVGENGSGKTTLMKMVLGFTSHDSGEIFFQKNENYQYDYKKLEKIAFLLDCKLFEYLNGYDNLLVIQKYNNSKLNKDELNSKIENMLEFVGLANNNKPVKSYSFGMKQRLGLAIALLGEPELLILDEPFVGLDPKGVKLFITYIKKLQLERQITILISSHQLHEIEQICDYYLLIKDESLVKISKEYESEFLITLRFLSSKLIGKFPKNVTVLENTIRFPKKQELLNQVIQIIVCEKLEILDLEIFENGLEKIFEGE